MKTNKTALALIAITVIIAGCTNGGGEESASTAGVQITNFSATPSSTFSGQSAQISMSVINQGGVDASNAVAKLYQAPIGGGPGSWEIESGPQIVDIGGIRAADPENEIPAQTRRQNWALTAPDLGSQSVDYNFQTRLYYDYSSEATTQIELVREDEFLQGDYSPSRPSTSNTDGPIQIDINTRSPVRYFTSEDGESSSVDSDLCVTVRNEGQGTPFAPSVDEYTDTQDGEITSIDLGSEDNDPRDKVEVSVSESAGVDFPAANDDGTATETVMLTGSRGNHCFEMTLPDSFSITQTVPLTIDASYSYYTDASTTATVQPRR